MDELLKILKLLELTALKSSENVLLDYTVEQITHYKIINSSSIDNKEISDERQMLILILKTLMTKLIIIDLNLSIEEAINMSNKTDNILDLYSKIKSQESASN